MRLLGGVVACTAGLVIAGCGSPAATHTRPAAAKDTHARRPAAAGNRARAAAVHAAAFAPGNPAGYAYVPAGAGAVNTARADRVVGNGTAGSCTSAAVVSAVAKGGVIKFNCGPKRETIIMRATAKVRNTSSRVIIDGGGKVTLSGAGARRILYMDTCDKRQVWTTSHCQNQANPALTVQNITFAHGNSTGDTFDGGGGGAIFARGGRLKVVNSTFIGNRCDRTGPDLGGAAIRALSQYRNRPVYIVHSTFTGGYCSNGAALSSIGVSWVVLNSLMIHNKAVGRGANPPRSSTPGGGSGGAIYNDGDRYHLQISGTVIKHNHAREGGGAIFFVSNDRTGTLRIDDSTLHDNPNVGFQTAGYPGIFFLGKGHPTVIQSTIN
ncbi:MAG: hypothetical protein ACTHJW_12025 [Streptosporangiaceae bacterium]